MDLNYVNSLIDKYNNLVIYYKVGDIFRLEQRIPRGLNNVVVENIGKLMIIKIKRLREYVAQMNREDIRIFHRYIGSEELTDLGIHTITIYNNLAQINDDNLFPEDAIYKQYPWKYKVLINELKEKYIIILSDNSNIWKYDIDNSNVQINSEYSPTVTEIPSYTLPLLSVNGTIITSLQSFIGESVTSIDFIDDWNVSNVTDMSGMFHKSIVTKLNLSSWNVSNVTNMFNMFNNAAVSELNLNNWDVSNVTNMGGMFYNTNISKLDLSNWDVSKVTNMIGMFWNTNIPELNLSNWNVSKVISMSAMFTSSKISKLDVSNWNISGKTSMVSMFNGVIISKLDLSSWNVSNVSDMSGMFAYSKITELNLSNWAVSDDIALNRMFYSSTIQSIILSKTGARILTQFIGNIEDWTVNNVPLTDRSWKDEWGEGPVEFKYSG